MSPVAVVVVTYNSESEIGACLDAALTQTAEIVVVDNASGDGTCAEVRKRNVRLIANPTNAGFAAAVNQGVRATSAPSILLLNPDAVIQTSLEPLVQALDRPGSGAAGGRLVGENGGEQAGFMVRRLPTAATLCFEVLGLNRLFPHNPVNWRYRCLDLSLSGRDPIAVEQPAGAFLMLRREAWDVLGGLDECFHPLWFEDVDFCHRLKDARYSVWYVPTAVAKHTGGHSIRNLGLELRELYWYGNLLEYASRYFPPFTGRMVSGSVIVGSILRILLGIGGRPRSLAVYRQVIGMAVRRLLARHSEAGCVLSE